MRTKEEKKVINQGIEETTNYYQRKYEENKRKKRRTDPARPSLIKRVAGILLDILCIGVIMVGIQILLFNTLYHPMGYYEDNDIVATLNNESHLYIKNAAGTLVKLNEAYDSKKKPEENYDVPITYFYSHNERAVKNNKLEEYNVKKANSILFVYSDGVFTRSTSATDLGVKTFLENEYVAALKYFKSDPVYVQHTDHAMLINVSTVMANGVISSAIFYLLIPVLDKKHRTIGMMATRTILVTHDKTPSTRQQVALRYVAIVIMNFLSPCGMFILYQPLVGLIWFANMGIICFTPDFDSLHGVFSKTKVINASFSNPMESYKQIQDMIEIEKQNNPDAFKKEEK